MKELLAFVALGLAACSTPVEPAAPVKLTKQEREAIWEQKQAPEAEAEVAEIIAAVEEEARRLGSDHWAGTYYHGDGLGVNVSLHIAPNAGFAFEWHGCLGLYDRNYGSVETTDGLVLLSPTFHNSREGFHGIRETFRPVRWGDRQHLVAPEQMLDFCDGVKKGLSGYGILVKNGGWQDRSRDEVFGMPDIPAEFLAYLEEGVIRGRITRVGEPTLLSPNVGMSYRETELTLDVGSKHGVHIDMQFSVSDTEQPEFALVREVFEDHCIAVIARFDDSRLPAVGTMCWTGSRLPLQQD